MEYGRALEEERREECGGIHELELLDKVVERSGLARPHPSSWPKYLLLAQVFAANAMPQEFQDVVPLYLHVFEDVFSKALFDLLLECKQWDHAIELLPDFTPSSYKVYSLAPRKQDKLDAFLPENLDSGCICPSKSLMASPVFFIKKKDGSLQLVQDYWVLNAMTVKNCYPLPFISELINNHWSVQYFTKLDVQWGYNNMCI
ncbi:hypothetical protein E4T56_gene18551 [Termitomyces sp. T112]|nr:hypothetical protein E4T56_gene18551 [Termitomyces sp. T112]